MQASTTVTAPERSAMGDLAFTSDVILAHRRSRPARLSKMTSCLIGFSLAIALAVPARAQSLKDVENRLYKKEQFFQPVNTEAPKFALQDADGRPWDLDNLKGKVVVLHFIYASCKDVCPLHADLIAHIQEMIKQTPMHDHVQFVSITTDPARDTPDVLKAYGPIHGLDPTNWVFLTARPGQPDDATRQLAERFGLKFTKTEDGEFVHGVVTNIIDRDGMLRAKFHGLNFDPSNLVSFITFLVNYVHKPGEIEDTTASAASPPTISDSSFDPKNWIPIVLLVLAAAWLIGATTFFRRRRKRAGHNIKLLRGGAWRTRTRSTGGDHDAQPIDH